MLISITDKCRMNCPHCLDDAKETNNGVMDFATLEKSIDFANKYCAPIIITGGEPTEHPEFGMIFQYIMGNYLLSNLMPVALATNGMNFDKESVYFFDTLYKMYKDRFQIQVTHDKRYYKKDIDLSLDIFKRPYTFVVNEIQYIYPIGRAKDNNIPYFSNASKCFNIRSISHQRQEYGLKDLLLTLAMNGKMCTPKIAHNGDLKLGESNLCPVCSNIFKSEKDIMEDIRKFTCHKCDLINDKLPDMYKQLIDQ